MDKQLFTAYRKGEDMDEHNNVSHNQQTSNYNEVNPNTMPKIITKLEEYDEDRY